MTPIPITIVRTVHATGKTFARTTMVFLARRRRNVCPIIASMGFVAAIFAWAHVKLAPRRKKAVGAMESAEALRRIRIPTMNAIPANVMARAPAMLHKRRPPMVRRAHHLRNARPAIAQTVSVVIAGV
jgi:hypothetical protein